MDKLSITMTADDDWWLERVTMEGEQRYPERIRVGSADDPRVYVPERTCHVERVSTPYHGGPPRCSACMMPLEPLVNYCSYCGARVVAS